MTGITFIARIRVAVSRIGIGVIALSVAAAPAQAGVGDEMSNFFNDMGASANATGATAYQGQSAGYYSLGSVWARFPQKSVYPANIQLPKVRAGCGGIDIFSGSFSFINMSEFVANLKAIANNAIGFAFKLAIDSISPQIGGVMDQLQDIANKVNQFNMQSCEAAAAAVGAVWPKVDAAEDRICQSIGTSAGRFSDWAKSRRGCGNGGERSSTINSNTDPSLAAMTPGPKNYAWDMIKQSPLESADRQMRELVMTLTGTIVVGKRPSDNDPLPIIYRGEGDPAILDALLDGDKAIDVLGCDETDKCLSPGKRTIPALGGTALRPRVAALIQSMSDKVRTNAALTTEEKNLLGVASIPLYKVVAVQAASGFNLSPGELNSLAEVTAIDLLNSIVQRMLDQVAAGQSNNSNQADSENLRQFNEQLARVRQRLFERESTVNQRVTRTFEIVDRAMMIESTLQTRMAPGMAASLNFSRALSAQGLRP